MLTPFHRWLRKLWRLTRQADLSRDSSTLPPPLSRAPAHAGIGTSVNSLAVNRRPTTDRSALTSRPASVSFRSLNQKARSSTYRIR